MALPEILIPAGLPDFKASGYTLVPDPLYVPVERQGGGSRRRRVYTSVPRKLSAQLELTQAQLEAFVDWHERVLKAGSRSFAAKVAKVGPGVEYWEAYCRSFTVEHQEGSLHTVNLDLLLKGPPTDALPTPASLTAEVGAGLTLELPAPYAYALTAEFFGELEAFFAVGAALSAECVARLDVECSGAVANPSLLAEAAASLEAAFVNGASAALAAEFDAALSFGGLAVPLLAAEFTAAVGCYTLPPGGVGYRNPSPVSVSADYAPYKGIVTAALALCPAGEVHTKEHTSAYVLVDEFYTPVTPGVADGKWVRAVLTAGNDLNLVPRAGVTRQFVPGEALTWVMSAPWTDPGVTYAATLAITIANDPDFLDVLSTFTTDLSAAWAGA